MYVKKCATHFKNNYNIASASRSGRVPKFLSQFNSALFQFAGDRNFVFEITLI